MARAVTLGNGRLLICLDYHGQVRDLYFHYAGLENHVSEHFVHKIGVSIDGVFSWIDSGEWEVSIECEEDTMASQIFAINQDKGLSIHFTDIVYNEKNIFIRELKIKNLYDSKREVKIFFNQQFNISQTHTGDTAYYDPNGNVVIHYKGRRVFLANLLNEEKGMDSYSIGLMGIEGKEGTYKDAEDAKLSKNPIEHGQVDSVIQADVIIEPKKEKTLYYWMTIAKSIKKAKELDEYVLHRGPSSIAKTTKDYWEAWVKNQRFSFYGLSKQIISLFNKSLITIRTHVNKNGSIIASGDSELLQYGRDTYAYVWPRDAAFSVEALARSGDFNASRRFFAFFKDVITPDGYFMHKYRPDKSPGSSWHPWIEAGKPHLPIQEDEIALVVWTFWTHYELSKDLEFVEEYYNPLIKKAAEFMCEYVDEKTALPKQSYDLWEMKYGIHTFTSSAVYGALKVGAKFAALLGKEKSADKYNNTADKMRNSILEYLYDKKTGLFHKSVYYDENSQLQIDKTVDFSSIYGIYKFKVLPFDDTRLKTSFEKFVERLKVDTHVGGIARFEGDQYHRRPGNIPGNPWIITTSWLTQYYINFIRKESDLPDIVKRFTWIAKSSSGSGMLSEQLDPYTAVPVSASPLTWSHAEYVISVINYLEKLEELGICKACYPVDNR